MDKKLDTGEPAKIIKISPDFSTPRNREAIEGAVVEIRKINFVYDNGDVGGLFRVVESTTLPKNLPLLIPRVRLENI